MKTLRLILGDQLNHSHSWFETKCEDTVYCMFEMRQETDYVTHHIQKIVAFFKAMRLFAAQLESRGHKVIYYRINDSRNQQRLGENIQAIIEEYNIDKFEYQLPDEYRLDRQLDELCEVLDIASARVDSEHFLCKRQDLDEFFNTRKNYVMESFYRSIRKSYDILMEDGKPVGGKWNYDHDNRSPLKKGHKVKEYSPRVHPVEDVLKDIEKAGIEYIGRIEPEKFIWPVDRRSALDALDTFLKYGLAQFGTYQDAMHDRYPFLYHSRLSFALNSKLINPMEVVAKTRDYWKSHPDIDISNVEGFIRQIIGWREYMRGIYWAHMP